MLFNRDLESDKRDTPGMKIVERKSSCLIGQIPYTFLS